MNILLFELNTNEYSLGLIGDLELKILIVSKKKYNYCLVKTPDDSIEGDKDTILASLPDNYFNLGVYLISNFENGDYLPIDCSSYVGYMMYVKYVGLFDLRNNEIEI